MATFHEVTRRSFMKKVAAGSAAATVLGTQAAPLGFAASADKPALLGGTPVHRGGWPTWPQWDEAWEPKIVDVLRSGVWCRASGGDQVPDFETAYARLVGAKRCVATASGTTALFTALYVMGVDAGDEVIVSPYTFIATYNAILMQKALPVLADTDPSTLTMDPASIESRITDRTVAVLPVHIGGMPCDMDPINAIAKKHGLAVIEDACQAWLSEYKGRKCGTLGDLGCFSFQNSKHIPSGEGGAVTSNDEALIDRCSAFHNCGRAVGSYTGEGYFTRGSNFRLTHIQAMLLLQEFDKLKADTAIRRRNADYLIAGLKRIPGIATPRLPGDGRPSWYHFSILYDSAEFGGLSRSGFIRALRAEGVPCSDGYGEQYNDGLLDEAIASRGFKRLFPAARLKAYRESFRELHGNRHACETTVRLPQKLLLADRQAMDDILEAIAKIRASSGALKS